MGACELKFTFGELKFIGALLGDDDDVIDDDGDETEDREEAAGDIEV